MNSKGIWHYRALAFDIRSIFNREETLASRLSVALIYAGIFLRDIASAWLSPNAATPVLAAGLFLALISLGLSHIKPKFSLYKGWRFLAILTLTWLAGIAATQTFNTSSYYLAPIIAYLIINTAPKTFFTLITAHLFLNVCIQGIEYLTNSYLFIYETKDGSELDEKLFGGAAAVFRAKGFFQGPLSAVAFAAWLAFLNRGSTIFALLLLISAFLAGGRLGIIIGIILFLIRLHHYQAFQSKRSTTSTIILLATITLLALTVNVERIEFIANAFNTENNQNLGRLYYWTTSLAHYLNYPIDQLLFGNYGFIKTEIGGTENDFLRILLDNGILCFALYLYALINSSIHTKPKKNGVEPTIITILIFVMMNAFPFIQSLNSAILFWLYIFFRTQKQKPHNR